MFFVVLGKLPAGAWDEAAAMVLPTSPVGVIAAYSAWPN